MDEFELQLRKANVDSWRSQYQYFDQAIAGRAKMWVREWVQYGHGQRLYNEANAAGADERSWCALYYFMRRELMLRVGVQYEEPAEATREVWGNITLPETFRHEEDVHEALDRVTMAHTRMYKTGVFRDGCRFRGPRDAGLEA